jgi:hypothetical protein
VFAVAHPLVEPSRPTPPRPARVHLDLLRAVAPAATARRRALNRPFAERVQRGRKANPANVEEDLFARGRGDAKATCVVGGGPLSRDEVDLNAPPTRVPPYHALFRE